MKNKLQINPRLLFFLKCFLFCAILTGILLLLLALLMYRLRISENLVVICVTAIYVIVTFFAGFITGKREQTRKFLWGLLAGILYFLILLLLSLCFSNDQKPAINHALTILALCAGGGMLGGMLS